MRSSPPSAGTRSSPPCIVSLQAGSGRSRGTVLGNGGAERLRPAGEAGEPPARLGGREAVGLELRRKRDDIGLLARPETAVAAAPERRAQRAAAGPRDRPQAARPGRYDDARVAAPLALEADGLVGELRPATHEDRGEELTELLGGDRAAPELGVDLDVVAHRRDLVEDADQRRIGVDAARPVLGLAPVAHRLDAAGRRARADRDEHPGPRPQVVDPLELVRVADRAFHEEN